VVAALRLNKYDPFRYLLRRESHVGQYDAAEVSRRVKPTGRVVTDAAFATVRLHPHRFHGEWSYVVHPHVYV